MDRNALVRMLIAGTLLCGGIWFMPAAAQEATPAAASGFGCTAWQAGTPGPVTGPEECTRSEPWWTSWSSCAITRVHSEAYDPSLAGGGVPETIPWVRAEHANAVIIGHQWYGNRPLHVGGSFPADGTNAKVLWHFSEPVRDLTITATNLDDASAAPVAIETGPANTSPASTQWPSSLAIPSAGCWRVDLHATDDVGNPVTGSVTYIVVE